MSENHLHVLRMTMTAGKPMAVVLEPWANEVLLQPLLPIEVEFVPEKDRNDTLLIEYQKSSLPIYFPSMGYLRQRKPEVIDFFSSSQPPFEIGFAANCVFENSGDDILVIEAPSTKARLQRESSITLPYEVCSRVRAKRFDRTEVKAPELSILIELWREPYTIPSHWHLPRIPRPGKPPRV